jgi:hypothetical protein
MRVEFQILQLDKPYIGAGPTMTTHVLQFVELSDQDRKAAKTFDKLVKGDQVEVRVRRKSGEDQVVRLPPKAAALLETALGHLLQGERVAVLAEDQELSPNDAADWESPDRWSFIGWTSGTCHSDMSANTAARS